MIKRTAHFYLVKEAVKAQGHSSNLFLIYISGCTEVHAVTTTVLVLESGFRAYIRPIFSTQLLAPSQITVLWNAQSQPFML